MPEIRHVFTQAGHTALLSTYESLAEAAQRYGASVQKAERQIVTSNRRTVRSAKGVKENEVSPARATEQLAKQVAKDQDAQLQRLKRNIREQIRLGEMAGKARAREEDKFRKIREKAFSLDNKAHEKRVADAKRLGEREGRARVAAMHRVPQLDSTKALNRGSMGMDIMTGVAQGGIALAAAAVAGTVSVVADAAKDAMRLQEQANRISVNARTSGKGFIDPTELRKEFEQTAIATPGIKSSDVAEAVQAYITKTGDIKTARAMQGTFATVSSATGADIREVSSTAAELSQKFDISSIDDMREALAALTYQGKEGAFELSDAAERFSKMAAGASAFGFSKGTKGLRTLGGLSQIAQSATGESRVTATAVEAMLRQFVSNSGKVKTLTGGKVNVFKDKGHTQTNDIQDLIVDTIAGTKGDLTKLHEIFGDEGKKALLPLISTFNEAGKALGPKAAEKERVDAGSKAVRAQLSKAIDAPGSWKDVQQDAAQIQQSASARMDAAWEKLQSAVAEKLVPVLTDLATRLADMPELFDALGAAVGGFVDFLEYVGVVKHKDRNTGTVREEAAKKIEKAQQEIDAAKPYEKRTAEEQEAFNVAIAKRTDAANVIERSKKLDEAVATAATPQEFGALYAGLSGKNDNATKIRAQEMAKRVFETQGREAPINGEETEEQRMLREGVMKRERKIAGVGGGPKEAEGLAPALADLVAAVKKAAGDMGAATGGGKAATVAPS